MIEMHGYGDGQLHTQEEKKDEQDKLQWKKETMRHTADILGEGQMIEK